MGRRMKRLVLVSVAILAIVAAPVMAQAQPWTITHVGEAPPRPLAHGDIVVSVSWFDGETARIIDGVAILMNARILPVCDTGPARPLG